MNTEHWRIGLHALPVGRQQIELLSLSLSLCTVQNLFFGLSCLPFFPPSTLFILSSARPFCFSLPVLSPWSEWGNRGVQWGNAVWIIQPWHFGARLVFPGQPVLCVCYYLMVPDAMIHYSFLWKGTMGRSWQLIHTKTFSSSNCPQYPTPCYTHHHTPNYQPRFIVFWLRFRLHLTILKRINPVETNRAIHFQC